MELLFTALLIGLMGSFHCAGMCGPIAISLPLRGENIIQKTIGGLLYNFGRTITYGLMGAIFGLIGQGFQLLGFQRWISMIMGVLMIVSVLFPVIFRRVESAQYLGMTAGLRRAIQKLFMLRSFGGLFLIGLLNGLLPCGLVYMAIAGAIGTGDAFHGTAYMIIFGLGTIPMMLFILILGNIISGTVRSKINKIIPYLVVFVGLIFILRGLTLGIPYLSPPQKKLSPEFHSSKTLNDTTKVETKGACCHQ
jgi:sulfite exporter TauE/SafE